MSEGDTPPILSLGRLAPMHVRDVWPNEGRDFTPWLLYNADVLSQVLNMDLDLQAAEHRVGDFYLDLVGLDTATGERVIVENQLGASDHGHLGQILTYAGGTDPVNIVWVAPRFRDEHRAAIDWLNGRTDERTRFFAVELSVVRIGDSAPAPLLRLVAAPNDWEKRVRASAGAPDDGGALYQQFWQRYLDTMRARGRDWTRTNRAPSRRWINLPSGVSGVTYDVNFQRRGLCSEIYIGTADPEHNTKLFHALRERGLGDAFGDTLGPALQWEELPARKGCRVALYRPGAVDNTEEWTTYIEWFIDSQSRFRGAIDAMGGWAALELEDARGPGRPAEDEAYGPEASPSA